MEIMCPSCGTMFVGFGSTVPDHSPAPPTREVCAGSGQSGRNPYSDRRFLWNGKPNPHIDAASGQPLPCTTTTHAPIVVDGVKRAFDPWTDTQTTAMNAAGEQVPLILADAQAVTISGRPVAMVGEFAVEAVGRDWDGTFKPIDQLSYTDAKIVVGSRLHPDDLLGRVIERPHVECSVCGVMLYQTLDGKHIGKDDGAGGFTCPTCTTPPDAPHVVGSK